MADGSPTADAFAERVLASALGWVDTMAMYVGDRLGWYSDLAANGPTTADELAARTNTSPRYAREWLEQQAVTGVLQVDDARDEHGARRFILAPGPAEVLTNPASLNYLAPVGRMFAASAVQLPALLTAYRDGGGVSWDALGDDARESQADLNRPWFDALPEAFAGLPELHERLQHPDARAADVGCGAGWSAISLARAYPGLKVEGFDVDGPSIEHARRNADDAGVADRVRFHLADGASMAEHTPFDAVFAFECIHDMPQPVPVLAGMRAAMADDGFVIVMDEAVASELAAPGDKLERLMYGYSLFVCLPDGMSTPGSVGTGTVMRPSTLERYVLDAGFTGLSVLPIEHFGFWRFYRLEL